MAIKIQTQLDYIPIQLGDVELRFDISDDAILKLRNGYKEAQKRFDEIALKTKNKELTEEEGIEKSKEVLRNGFEFLYGEGSFEKVYEISPSVVICMNYYTQISEAVLVELDKLVGNDKKQKVDKYLQNKKRNNQNKNKRKK